jgi:hypothetical protein
MRGMLLAQCILYVSYAWGIQNPDRAIKHELECSGLEVFHAILHRHVYTAQYQRDAHRLYHSSRVFTTDFYL